MYNVMYAHRQYCRIRLMRVYTVDVGMKTTVEGYRYLVRGHQIYTCTYMFRYIHMYIHVQYCLTIVNGYQDGFNKSFSIFLDVVAPAIVGNDILIGEVRWDFKSS